MPSRQTSQKSQPSNIPKFKWADKTELVGLALQLKPNQDILVSPSYTTELHSWFLDQVRRSDADLSAYLHDGQSEKPFTVSNLQGPLQTQGRSLRLAAAHSFEWIITALSQPVVQWMRQWLCSPPVEIQLRSGSFHIEAWEIAHPPTTYVELFQAPFPDPPTISLSFLTPTSFRRKGNHFPLPVPTNLFHSYLRRWNDFSNDPVDQGEFLDWVEECVIILRHQLQSAKVMAGKSGSVTGFTGSIQLGVSSKAKETPEWIDQWLALGQLVPYCGTGHKTTFGLGQTRLGWLEPAEAVITPSVQGLLAQRIAELTELFVTQRKRTGGDRATNIAETWATTLARRELGESLQTIAEDLGMPYETVKTYVKLARRSLKDSL